MTPLLAIPVLSKPSTEIINIIALQSIWIHVLLKERIVESTSVLNFIV